MTLVEKTWQEYGRKIRALGDVVFVRTDPADKISPGGILYPETTASFYNGLPKGQHKWGTVVSVGPDCQLEVGDRILFPRIDFAWSHKFDDGTLLGYAREEVVMLKQDQI